MKSSHGLALLLFVAGIGPIQATELRLHEFLSGTSVVSATDSKATGEATAALRDDGKVRINLVFGRLASVVTGAALHAGTSTEKGSAAALPLNVSRTKSSGRGWTRS